MLAKAQSWLKLAVTELPNATVFLVELNKWQYQVMTPDMYEKMRKLKFADFTSELDRLIKKFRDGDK
jgi:hypothetical protein